MAMFDKHKTTKPSTPAKPVEPEVSRAAPPAAPAPTSSASNKVAMIGQGISIAGDVVADSNLKVEGRIEGRNVQSSQDVEIAESGTVRASIVAREIRIAGEVIGDVGGAEKVYIARTGRVQGNIVAPRVQLEDGALFRGSIDMNPTEAAASKSDNTPKKAATSEATAAKPASPKAVPAGKDVQEPGLNLKSG
jgi:cytoskeletal protein CcmA (bactofilin family)